MMRKRAGTGIRAYSREKPSLIEFLTIFFLRKLEFIVIFTTYKVRVRYSLRLRTRINRDNVFLLVRFAAEGIGDRAIMGQLP